MTDASKNLKEKNERIRIVAIKMAQKESKRMGMPLEMDTAKEIYKFIKTGK